MNFWMHFSLDVAEPACNRKWWNFAKVVPRLKMHLDWVNTRHFLQLLKRPEMCVRPILCRGFVAFLGFLVESAGFGEFPVFY